MGLDVYLVKGRNAQGGNLWVTWGETSDFPYQPVTEKLPGYYDEYDQWIPDTESSPFIAEITGMWVHGNTSSISFQGNGYSSYPFLPYSFHGELEGEALQEQMKALRKFLEIHKGDPPETEDPTWGDPLSRIRWFGAFLEWVAAKGYSLEGCS